MTTLTNARFASSDGTVIESHPLYPVNLAIDGNRGLDGSDHAAHPVIPEGRTVANFYVDLVEEPVVLYVYIWPRVQERDGGYDLTIGDYYYLGMKVYIGSVECPPDTVYNATYVRNTIIREFEPLVFTCPPGTKANNIVVLRDEETPGAYREGYVQLAEIEAYVNIQGECFEI